MHRVNESYPLQIIRHRRRRRRRTRAQAKLKMTRLLVGPTFNRTLKIALRFGVTFSPEHHRFKLL